MSLKTSTLVPGLLVSLKTKVTGNVTYKKTVIEEPHLEGETQKAKWETERTTIDPGEHELAGQVRGRCSSLIRGICAKSDFGLLCPEAKARDLEKAVAEARRLAAAFNADAKVTEVEVYVVTGRIAPDDVEAVRAINSEVRDLLEEMKAGLKKFDVDAVRAAANKANKIETMLSAEAAGRLKLAVKSVRGAARKIVKAGEVASTEMNELAIRALTEASRTFIDLDVPQTEIDVPEEEGRAIDLLPLSETTVTAPDESVPAFELDSPARESSDDAAEAEALAVEGGQR